ncbi:unnamed protein product [Nippostrongylus brasiliensis]|uniref:PiggyBac transposable element-derived protein 4 (inferred by orthology to a human protein) n=1 Tax=Nippostrongylus brasiliensis TaxID=27835 RepID=A0A0N4XS57_NIPBR|nr:unnamed protein product [Nippostrongylus brasiliensis]
MVMKWKDKREIFMLSTSHDNSFNDKGKPTVVEKYNQMKAFVDLSDQMAAYTPFVRKTTKWYIRLFFHLLTQTAVINAWFLYCKIKSTKSRLNDFKLEIVESLLEFGQADTTPITTSSTPKLEEVHNAKGHDRRRCGSCYENLCKTHGRTYASSNTKRVRTRCSNCQKYFCANCFVSKHNKCFQQQ